MRTVRKRYADAMKGVTNFPQLYSNISVWLDRWNKQNFKTQGGKVGGWKPFKLGGRPTKGGGIDKSAKLLQDTGHLRASFLPIATSRAGGISSDLYYAEAHQEGMGPLPQRRMVPEPEEVIDDIMQIADKHADKHLRKLK